MHVLLIARNPYKANVLLLLLSNLVNQKIFIISFDITTEQSFRYIELIVAKIWVSKSASLCWIFEDEVTYII